jgi:hypothetical protein
MDERPIALSHSWGAQTGVVDRWIGQPGEGCDNVGVAKDRADRQASFILWEVHQDTGAQDHIRRSARENR